MKKLAWGSLVLSEVFVACGGDAPPVEGSGGTGGSAASGGGSGGDAFGGAPSGGAAAVDEPFPVCVAYIAAICERRGECAGTSTVECAAEGSLVCPDALFSEGSTRTVESVLACIEDWKTFPCESALAMELPSCVTKGSKVDGEAWLFHSQCASGECTGDSMTCGRCIPSAPPGGACEVGILGCVANETCDGATCVPAEFVGYPIVQAKSLGEACDGDCVEGALCVADDLLQQRICRPNRAAGETWYREYPTVDAPLVCSREVIGGVFMGCDEGTGECLGWAALNEPCRPAVDPAPPETLGRPFCGTGLYCEVATHLCRAYPSPGGPCLRNEYQLCAPDEECDDDVCRTSRFLGESCGPTTTCAGQADCVGGVCVGRNEVTLFGEICVE